MAAPAISLTYVGKLANEDEDKRARKAQPTPADKAAAARIKQAWEARFKGELTQEELGARFRDIGETAGKSQGAISQYMNGKIPINTLAVLFFAHELKMDPREIRDDLPDYVLAQLREELPLRSSSDRASLFPFPFSRAEWEAVADDVKRLIVHQMQEAVEMARSPAPGGRRLPAGKS